MNEKQASKFIDKKLTRMETFLFDLYRRTEADITAEWYKYMDELNTRLTEAVSRLKTAKSSGDSYEIAKAKKELDEEIKIGTILNEKYQQMLNITVDKLTNLNEIALAYVNGELPPIYALNYNAVGETIQGVIKGYSFTLVNEETVRQLTVLNTQLLLPPKKINKKKDKKWNIKKINSELLQGILQGDDIPTIAARILKVTNSNYKSAVRNARTMVTAAENRGRLAGQERAQKMGIILQKEWLATPDKRTRDSHFKIDGQRRDIDKEFSNGLLCPGDRAGRPEEVYNCRCRMNSVVIGTRRSDGTIIHIDRDDTEDLHDKQMAEERKRREEERKRKDEQNSKRNNGKNNG